jgi:hypothetical protein
MRDAESPAAGDVDDDVDPVAVVGDAAVMMGWSVVLLLLLAAKQLAMLSKPAFIDVIAATMEAIASLNSSAEIAGGTSSLLGRLGAV